MVRRSRHVINWVTQYYQGGGKSVQKAMETLSRQIYLGRVRKVFTQVNLTLT